MTFDPEVKFVKTPAEGQSNLPQSAGLQVFGLVGIDGATDQMAVRLMDRADTGPIPGCGKYTRPGGARRGVDLWRWPALKRLT